MLYLSNNAVINDLMISNKHIIEYVSYTQYYGSYFIFHDYIMLINNQ